ncbi:MAG: PEGA domain-containing protein [Bacteroidetes bacterium]|nr:PEGA domain-containing protein [Bacteroidota bacterium]MDA0903995.1 PEGA domain-containing protein [Bacteroidota bacterium]MDA1243015.1 PEGA domain-containing protein [Bacteroidota bacterium]
MVSMTFSPRFQNLTRIVLVASFLLPACASSVRISSSPSQADVYADGHYIGQTPVRHRDAKISGTNLDLRLEKEGYEVLETQISKDARINVRALLGSMFVIPLAWILAYPRSRNYVMKPLGQQVVPMQLRDDDVLVEVQTNEALGSDIFVVSLDNSPCQSSSTNSVLEAAVGIRLMRAFRVLERRELDVVSSEQRRNMAGLHDESSIVEAGKLSGARGVVLVSRTCEQRSTLTSMRFVDCETGALHWAVLAKDQPLDAVVSELLNRLKP